MGKRLERSYSRRKRAQIIRRVILITLILLAVIITVVFVRNNLITHEKGLSKETLKLYGTVVNDAGGGGTISESTVIEDNVGVSKYYQNTDYQFINEFRENYEQDVLKKLEPDQDVYKAVSISSAVNESDMGTVSLLMAYTIMARENGDTVIKEQEFKTFLFNKDNGYLLTPKQLFREDYKENAKTYLTEYFLSNYGEKLTDDWESSLEKEKENLEDFMVGQDVTYFIFDSTKVLSDGEGLIDVKIPEHVNTSLVRDKLITRYVDKDKPMVAITFDDGPGGKNEKRIHEILKKYNAVATFFYTGVMVKHNEELMKDTVDMGCEIGSHTWNHPVLTRCSDDELVKKQFNKTNKAIKNACGVEPTVFRPSYGATNNKINKKSKKPVILWDVDTLDWKTRDAKKIMKSVKKQKNLDGRIILMHSIYDTTADATAKMVPWLQKHGYQLVTVSEMIEYKYGEEPKAGKVYSYYKYKEAKEKAAKEKAKEKKAKEKRAKEE